MLNNISFVSENNFWPYITFNVLAQRMDFVHILADYMINKNSSTGNVFADTTHVFTDTTYGSSTNNSDARKGVQWLIKLGAFIAPDKTSNLANIYHYYQDNLTSTNLFLDPLTQYTFGMTGSLDGKVFGEIASGVNAILADERGDDSVQKPDFLDSV